MPRSGITDDHAQPEKLLKDWGGAIEVWKFKGMPDNPSAWLMAIAKNRALEVLRRQRTARTYGPEFGRLLESEWTLAPVVEAQFSETAIKDGVLRMMVSLCQPLLPEEAQVGLILHILCGFSVGEVAGAFISTHAAVEKRITRSKKVLAESKRLFDLADAGEFVERLSAAHRALYLLFNEGYHGASPDAAVRGELCREAMRLTALLIEQLSRMHLLRSPRDGIIYRSYHSVATKSGV